MNSKDTLKIGRYDIRILRDGLFEAKAEHIVHLDGEAALRKALLGWGRTAAMLDVNCFAVHGPDGAMLIDAGVGTAWGPAFGAARTAMMAARLMTTDVVRVLLTHIHGDHALGLLDENDGAYFSNAEIWIPEVDLAFFGDPAKRDSVPEARRGGFAVTEKLLRAYAGRIRGIPHGFILDGMEAVPLPGHTPGHTGYRLVGTDCDLVILADALHVAELQLADPRIGLVFDLDPVVSAQTRQATLDSAARNGWIIAGGHLDGFGRIDRAEHGFRSTPLRP